MRPLILTLALTFPSIASAQVGGAWYGGPYAPSRVAPTYNYYNHAAPVYPVAADPFGSYGYNGWRQQLELRRIRFELESANWNAIPRRAAFPR